MDDGRVSKKNGVVEDLIDEYGLEAIWLNRSDRLRFWARIGPRRSKRRLEQIESYTIAKRNSPTEMGKAYIEAGHDPDRVQRTIDEEVSRRKMQEAIDKARNK